MFALVDVRSREFPVLLGIVDARQETFSLFSFREVQENFYDACPVVMQMFFESANRFVALLPNPIGIYSVGGQILRLNDSGMHFGDQNFFVIGAIENSDPTPLRQTTRGAP